MMNLSRRRDTSLTGGQAGTFSGFRLIIGQSRLAFDGGADGVEGADVSGHDAFGSFIFVPVVRQLGF